MKTFTHSLAWLASVSLLAVLVSAPLGVHAADPVITSSETVANVTTGTDNQTNATSSTQANVPEVKASRILMVGTAPVNAETVTVGACVVTFATTTAGSPSQDLNCTGGATITTATTTSDVAKTTAEIASSLAALTNATSTGHGALTVAIGTTTTKVSFTTTGTEASATNIGFTDGTSGKITSVGDTTGVIPVAQVWTVTPANVEIGDVFTTLINATSVAFTATAATVANVTAGLAAAINASAVASAVTAADATTNLTVTSDTAGTAFTITSTTTNRAAVAQQVTFTPENIGAGDTLTIVLGATTTTIAAPGNPTAQNIVEALVAALSGNGVATCTEDNAIVTCVAVTAGTSFSYSTSVTEAAGNGTTSHHSSGGGGSSNSNSNSSSHNADLQAKLTQLKALLAQLLLAKGNTTAAAAVSGAFKSDLTVGSTGAEVKSLQMYLNAKGFTVSATGAGSVGNETMTFGAATQAALAKFQAAKGIVPAVGYFGPKTRAYVNANP